jgi:hypothetical protein
MINSLALVAALWPDPIMQYCPPPKDVLIVGIARNSRKDFLYCEWFTKVSDQKFTANYVQDSAVFAVKNLDFSTHPFIPTVTQTDYRTGELRASSILNREIKLEYRENENQKHETKSLPVNEVDVLDAGFNDFVRAHWDRLIAGEALPVNFGSIAHLKTLPLLISAKPTLKCKNNINKETQQAPYCFTVEINNRLLRLLIGNIKISYDKQRRLEEFDGMVNIQDDSQKTQSAIIHYYYSNDYTSIAANSEPKALKK